MTTIVVRKPELEKEVNEVTLKSYWLSVGELRLDASYHSKGVSRATELLEKSGYELVAMEDFTKKIFYLPRYKRYYADQNIGEPYLMPSELFFFPFSPSKFVYAEKLTNIEDWYVKEGWLLLTRSGRLGKITIATKSLESFIISDDIIRIIPRSESDTGFLYAYLCSWIGNALVTKDQYGVAVTHIEPHHVESEKIPLLPKEIRELIHKNILKVFQLREKARSLIAESNEKLSEELDLAPLEKPARPEPFSAKSSNLNLRLDASYHNPIVDRIIETLKKGEYESKRLGDGPGEAFIPGRFKRIYVGEEYGIPLLSGTQVVQMKPYDLKCISTKVTKNIENWIVRSGWVLVSCSGTIGRVALVPKEWDRWAISQHVLRIIPNAKEIDNGFLAAFLMNEYGHEQVISKTYGGVVDELAEDGMKEVVIPLPPMDIQERIGKLVVEAYELRELANKIEDETVKTLENMLSRHKRLERDKEYFDEIESYVETFDLIGDEEFRKSLEQANRGDVVPYEAPVKEE